MVNSYCILPIIKSNCNQEFTSYKKRRSHLTATPLRKWKKSLFSHACVLDRTLLLGVAHRREHYCSGFLSLLCEGQMAYPFNPRQVATLTRFDATLVLAGPLPFGNGNITSIKGSLLSIATIFVAIPHRESRFDFFKNSFPRLSIYFYFSCVNTTKNRVLALFLALFLDFSL